MDLRFSSCSHFLFSQCLPRYEEERYDADLLHIAVSSWLRLRERVGGCLSVTVNTSAWIEVWRRDEPNPEGVILRVVYAP
jgi:hypothetical protein